MKDLENQEAHIEARKLKKKIIWGLTFILTSSIWILYWGFGGDFQRGVTLGITILLSLLSLPSSIIFVASIGKIIEEVACESLSRKDS